MANNIPTDPTSRALFAQIYQQGAEIYGDRLPIRPGTEQMLARAFEAYREELSASLAPTTGTVTTATTETATTISKTYPRGPVLGEAARGVLSEITKSPGIAKSTLIGNLSSTMRATHVGLCLRTLLNAGLIAGPDTNGPFYPKTPTGTETTDRRGDSQIAAD